MLVHRGTDIHWNRLIAPLKITIVQGAFLPVPPLRGGAVEKMWFLLGQEFCKAGHSVTHLSRKCDGLPLRETIGGVNHVRVEGYDTPVSLIRLKWRDLRYSVRVNREISDADVIVTNTFWLPVVRRFARRGKLFIDVQRIPKGQMWLYRHAATLRANSGVVEKAIHADDPESFGRTCMIPNPLTFSIDADQPLGPKQPVILYTGRIHPEKGISILLEAFAKVSHRFPNWTLRLVGPVEVAAGGGGEKWFEKLRRNWSNARVEWVPPIYDSDRLNTEYRRASVFAYPSVAERGETFGLAPLEAMAWGCVPIVSNLECFRDFVVHGRNGVVFDHRGDDPAEALAKALDDMCSDPDRSALLACNAMEVRETHNVSKIAKLFLEQFELICRSGGQGVA